MNRKGQKRTPSHEDWRGYKSEPHVRRAHDLFFGKSVDEIQHYFGERPIELAQALRHMPRGAFRYYVQAFAAYLLSDAGRGDCDAASAFLGLLGDREELDSGSVCEIYEKVADAIEFLASHQKYFDAEPAIYGFFRDRADAVIAVCAEKPST